MNSRIYLDNNATTTPDPRVVDSILAELSLGPSNPSSHHFYGQQAKQRLQQARLTISSFLNVTPQEIVFTSGGTESMNLLIQGMFNGKFTGHVISSTIEHSCVHHTLSNLQQRGVELTLLSPGLLGTVSVDDIRSTLRENTRLIVLSAANNETGVKLDMEAVSELAKSAKIPLILDGVSLLGKELFSIPSGVTGIGFSAHKFHGPKGIGFIYLRSGTKIYPLFFGGDQEYGVRPGTENLPGIIGMAKAIELLRSELPSATHHMALLRNRLENNLANQTNSVIINGLGKRIANTSNLCFPGIQGEDLLIALDLQGIAVSHGSACTSGALEPSRVLINMGIPYHLARTAIRFSLSRFTTEEEINACISTVSTLVAKLRGSSNK